MIEQEQIVIGVDCGVSGAWTFMTVDGRLLEMSRLPYTKVVNASGSNKSVLVFSDLVSKISDYQSQYDIVMLGCEHLHPVSTFSAITNFNFGLSMGTFETLACAFQIPFYTMTAKTWQKHHWPEKGMTHDKERSRLTVLQQHPELRDQLKFKNTADLAESFLVAKYLLRVL